MKISDEDIATVSVPEAASLALLVSDSQDWALRVVAGQTDSAQAAQK